MMYIVVPIQSIPNMLNKWQVWWACRPCGLKFRSWLDVLLEAKVPYGREMDMYGWYTILYPARQWHGPAEPEASGTMYLINPIKSPCIVMLHTQCIDLLHLTNGWIGTRLHTNFSTGTSFLNWSHLEHDLVTPFCLVQRDISQGLCMLMNSCPTLHTLVFMLSNDWQWLKTWYSNFLAKYLGVSFWLSSTTLVFFLLILFIIITYGLLPFCNMLTPQLKGFFCVFHHHCAYTYVVPCAGRERQTQDKLNQGNGGGGDFQAFINAALMLEQNILMIFIQWHRCNLVKF